MNHDNTLRVNHARDAAQALRKARTSMKQSPLALPRVHTVSDGKRSAPAASASSASSAARVVWVKTEENETESATSNSVGPWQRHRAMALTAKLAASGAKEWALAWGLSPDASPGTGPDSGCVHAVAREDRHEKSTFRLDNYTQCPKFSVATFISVNTSSSTSNIISTSTSTYASDEDNRYILWHQLANWQLGDTSKSSINLLHRI